MRLSTVKTYQSVRFNTKDETHFDIRIPRFAGIQMHYDIKLQVVTVEIPGKDSIIIFPTNIAYANVMEEESSMVAKTADKKVK